ncbi:competence protein ComJ [Pseudoxanthomonas wuyuanensis]|uniref:competence protein ComJ n=1 Tax=Pseudoxanthomonas wuyuanensis TaxID=1073196 RepID=UPI00138A5139|nr:competence protein ComJ [Pseudoxanthomonas wuyuanensis]
MQSIFELFVSYSQIAVFRHDLQSPFNSWTDEQVRQGFSWRPGSVSFKVLIESGTCSLEIFDEPFHEFSNKDCIRAIEVPFEVPKNGKVEIASISEGHIITISAGTVQLRFEAFDNNVIRLSFLRDAPPRFEVLSGGD